MRMSSILILAFVACPAMTQARAEPPLKISEFATSEELEAEVQSKLAELEPFLASDEAFADNLKRLQQAASMLAVAAQAMADHEQDSPRKPFAPDLRAAALRIAAAKSRPEAVDGLSAARAAWDGTSGKSAVRDYDWAQLVKQRPIMEEMEVRMMQLQRALRRPKELAQDSRHATAVAVANLTTLADTHEVKDQSRLPEWDKLSRLMLEQLKNTARAMKANQPQEAQAEFKAARATCVECHRQFKKEN